MTFLKTFHSRLGSSLQMAKQLLLLLKKPQRLRGYIIKNNLTVLWFRLRVSPAIAASGVLYQKQKKIVSVKTQFGNSKTHIWIIGLLKYIQSKYVSNLSVTDEGGIREGGSEKKLNEKKTFISDAIDSFVNKLTQTNLKNRNLPDLIKEVEKIAKDIHSNSQKRDPSQNEECD